jgi:hypothetical protein
VPDDAAAHIAFAAALYRGGELEKAIGQLRLACLVAPDLGTLDQLISQIQLDTADDPLSRQSGEPNTSPTRHVEMERREEAKDVPTSTAPGSTLPLYVFRSNNNLSSPTSFTPPAPPASSLEPLQPAPPPETPEVVDLVTPGPDPAPRSITLTSTAPGDDLSKAPASDQSGEGQDIDAREASAKAGSRGRSKRKKQRLKRDADSAELDLPLAERTKRSGWIKRLARKMWRRVAWPD